MFRQALLLGLSSWSAVAKSGASRHKDLFRRTVPKGTRPGSVPLRRLHGTAKRVLSQPPNFKPRKFEVKREDCPICQTQDHNLAAFNCGNKNCCGRNVCRNCLIGQYATEQTSEFNELHPRAPPNAGTLGCSCCRSRKKIPNNLIQAATEAARQKIKALGYEPQLGRWDARHESELNLTDTNIRSQIRSYFEHGPYVNVPDPISTWDVSRVKNFSSLFRDAPDWFTGKGLEHWNVSSATSMCGIFQNVKNFNAPIGQWDVSNVKDMSNIFRGAASFNQNLESWNTSSVKNMSGAFEGASSFIGQGLEFWNVSSATMMRGIFKDAKNFNAPIGQWNVSSVKDMTSIFNAATSFNQGLGSWNTSSVKNMSLMFADAKSFDQDLGSWNTSSLERMAHMFSGASSFTGQGLEKWDLSKCPKSNRIPSCVFDSANVTNIAVLEKFRISPS